MFSVKNVIITAMSLTLLGGIGVDLRSLSAPDDASPYHQRIRDALTRVPQRIGDWVGEDEEIPKAAVKMLRPNVAFSKRYRNLVSGRRAGFLLVQVADARDLYGHYPPVCYVVQGFKKAGAVEKDWHLDHLTIHGTEYLFEFHTFERSESKYIANFMIMPNGSTQPDMKAVDAQAADLRRRFYGAGQVQVIVDASYPVDERDEIVRSLVSGNREIIEAILGGESK